MRRITSVPVVMALATALLPFPATSASAVPAEPSDGAEPLVVERITPDALDEKDTLRISGEVTNTTSESMREVTVRVRYSKHPFVDRDALDDFASGDGWQPDAPGPEDEITDELPPGTGHSYSLSVPAEELGLGSYGVYPLVIEAVDGDGAVIGARYTFLPYVGDEDDPPAVDIAWVWPLMAPPQRADDDTFLGDGLSTTVAEEGRLGRLLSVGAQTPVSFAPGDEDLVELLGLNAEPSESPLDEEATAEETAGPVPQDETEAETDDQDEGEENGEEGEEENESEETDPSRTEGVPVTWAVDPGTLDDILRMAADEHDVVNDPLTVPAGSDPDRESVQADVAAQVWLREARRVLSLDTVVATPYASPDLAALLRNEMDGDAEASFRIGREAVERALGSPADERFALPAEGLMDGAVHTLFAEEGATRFLLTEDALPVQSLLPTTPTAQAPLPVSEGDSDEEPIALVADEGITEILSMPTDTPEETALALRRFVAETAMIAGENVGGDRVIVASPDSGWDPSREFAEGVLAATDELPWLSAERLDEIEPPAEEEWEDVRGSLNYPDRAAENELGSTYLGLVEDVSRDVRMFNSILVEDEDPFRPALVRLESVHWRDEEAVAGNMRSLVMAKVDDGLGDVRIIPGEDVTLASRTGITGILVANDLEDQSVYVHLSVFSENAERLSIGEYDTHFEIAPGAKTTVYVPLSARINGRTVVHASLHNSAGEPINSQAVQLPVNATGLGTQALLISGVGALILIAALAPRALRRWIVRRSRAAAEAERAAGETPEGDTPAGGASPEGADEDTDADGADPGPRTEGGDTPSQEDGAPGDDTRTPDGDTAPPRGEGS
ncbi:DUF6049 family protein [Nocardiopsis sp. N85]|uniref:DUF6049 family protein n=1 Tax=Nocardiopsis sp. N85 TaxID=3029400 RepID=UPI00237FBCFB|nr:DUF6049 family protein [Nocardiopsis sp. N85]MDE3723436.1 DUF6049 family protein [Nocardiopsis sp. N85]